MKHMKKWIDSVNATTNPKFGLKELNEEMIKRKIRWWYQFGIIMFIVWIIVIVMTRISHQ
jgi:hypothetical protein